MKNKAVFLIAVVLLFISACHNNNNPPNCGAPIDNAIGTYTTTSSMLLVQVGGSGTPITSAHTIKVTNGSNCDEISIQITGSLNCSFKAQVGITSGTTTYYNIAGGQAFSYGGKNYITPSTTSVLYINGSVLEITFQNQDQTTTSMLTFDATANR